LENLGETTGQAVGVSFAATICFILLYQGLRQFIAPSHSRRRFVTHAVMISGLILAVSFLMSDYNKALSRPGDLEPVKELQQAIHALISSDTAARPGKTRIIPPEDLASKVSPRTRKWLQGANVSYDMTPFTPGNTYQAHVTFPNGNQFDFNGGLYKDHSGHPVQAR
jgi:hypothetical protein